MKSSNDSWYLGNKTLRMDARTNAHTDKVKTVYPPQTKFAGGKNICVVQVTRPTLNFLPHIRNFFLQIL